LALICNELSADSEILKESFTFLHEIAWQSSEIPYCFSRRHSHQSKPLGFTPLKGRYGVNAVAGLFLFQWGLVRHMDDEEER